MSTANQIQLFSALGRRKYLCASEVPRFLDAASKAEIATQLLCCLLAFTGCRISEALGVTPAMLDAETNRVTFRTLKRRQLIYRAVPIPAKLMEAFPAHWDPKLRIPRGQVVAAASIVSPKY